MHDANLLLKQWRGGDLTARDQLFEVLYEELRQISAALLRAESATSLSTGDLVNEAVIRLIRLDRIEWSDKTHFLAIAARAMRRALVDQARSKAANKRQHHKVTLLTQTDDQRLDRIDLDALDKALIRLAVIDEQKVAIIEMRYFGGLTIEEIAESTSLSEATVKRQWRVARAWLYSALNEQANAFIQP
ncbi:MAG: ECF-type sigma factor [Pseudomonadota bacterium]